MKRNEQIIKALRCVAKPVFWEISKCDACQYRVTDNNSRGCDVGRMLLDAADALEKEGENAE